jgi:NTP pyrophosphatase (non-canonical NTP hydrolase)
VGVGTTANQKIESPLKKKESSLSVLDLDGVTEVLGVVDIHKDGVDARGAGKAEFVTVLPALTTAIRQFAEDRLWSIYHLPRNLILALIGEIGELAELLQWKGDDDNDGSFTLTLAELDSLSQELADVTIYLIRFADVCHVSLKDEMK